MLRVLSLRLPRDPSTTRPDFRGLFLRTLCLASLLAAASCGALFALVRTLVHPAAANFIAVPLALVLVAQTLDIQKKVLPVPPSVSRLLPPQVLIVGLPIASQALIMHCTGSALPLSVTVLGARVLFGAAAGIFLKRVFHVPVPETPMLCACLGLFDYVAPILVAELTYRLDYFADPRKFALALLDFV